MSQSPVEPASSDTQAQTNDTPSKPAEDSNPTTDTSVPVADKSPSAKKQFASIVIVLWAALFMVMGAAMYLWPPLPRSTPAQVEPQPPVQSNPPAEPDPPLPAPAPPPDRSPSKSLKAAPYASVQPGPVEPVDVKTIVTNQPASVIKVEVLPSPPCPDVPAAPVLSDNERRNQALMDRLRKKYHGQ